MYSFGVRSISGSGGGEEREASRGPRAACGAASLLAASFSPAPRITYSQSPSLPPSLPYPDSRYPPNPLAASNRLGQLTHTPPALSRGAMSSAVLRFSLQTLAASP